MGTKRGNTSLGVVSFLILAFFALGTASAQTKPNDKDLEAKLSSYLPYIYGLEDFELVGSENKGTKEDPDWTFRLKAVAVAKFDLYREIREYPFPGIKLIGLDMAENSRQGFEGVISAAWRDGQWKMWVKVEGDLVDDPAVPMDQLGKNVTMIAAGTPEGIAFIREQDANLAAADSVLIGSWRSEAGTLTFGENGIAHYRTVGSQANSAWEYKGTWRVESGSLIFKLTHDKNPEVTVWHDLSTAFDRPRDEEYVIDYLTGNHLALVSQVKKSRKATFGTAGFTRLGTEEQEAASADTAKEPSASDEPPTIEVTVLEALDGGPYSIVKVNDGGEEFWVVGKQTDLEVGSRIGIIENGRMKNFKSPPLDRKFDEVRLVKIIKIP